MRISLGTTAAESLCAAGNIFIGQTEAPILVGPFLELMTRSELHAVMTGGFATIAGGVLAAYVSFGVPAEHLLCASVMNAPCALAVSKLLYPETEESRLKNLSEIDITSRKERNILEAAAAGASSSIKLVANIAANLIAFLAMLAFVNAVFSWFGSFVGYPEFSFQAKSEVIAIYALCGFANFSSIGIQLGGLGPLAPKRKGDLAQVVLRALLGGIMACLLTASIAGLLVADPNPAEVCLTNGTALLNSTSVNSTLLSSFTQTSVSDTISHILNTTASIL
ncbi:hypothetical protein KUTeg_001642 [Tegillarca granosa]|uniref:Concentrative nucleoside transporter C-terminal domain-containing protein n=1 Tax=Tegillarca granosa TaxID=220873 RepID=A0ABQ9FWD0_TEGGR|nr:hypothetical protein KUTeg_001642 [Tegillarca granosa]